MKYIKSKILRPVYDQTRFFLFWIPKFSKQTIKKIDLGAGKLGFSENWLFTDRTVLDITNINMWKKSIKENSVDHMMAEHVWEHLTEDQGFIAIKNCYRFLKKGGTLRIAVPDGFHINENYINHVKPGGVGPGADDHKILYNYKSLGEIFEKVGFTISRLEYWDEKGQFHYTDWDSDKGHIKRSKRYDPRFLKEELNYTSLILEGIKNEVQEN